MITNTPSSASATGAATRIENAAKTLRRLVRTRLGSLMAASLLSVAAGVSYAAPLSSTVSESDADRITTERIYSALEAEPFYYFRHVEVHVRGGVATLDGLIFDEQGFYRASQIAAHTSGVVKVNDEMELERGGLLAD